MKKKQNLNSPSSLQDIILKKMMMDTSEEWTKIKQIHDAKISFEQKQQLTLNILSNLNKQLDILNQFQNTNPKIQQTIAHVVTAYTACLAIFCFANGWIDSGFLYSGSTAILGAIDNALYQSPKTIEHNLKCYRQNLITIAAIIKTKLNLKDTEKFSVELAQDNPNIYEDILTLTNLLKDLLQEATTQVQKTSFSKPNHIQFFEEKYSRLSVFVTTPQSANNNFIAVGYSRFRMFVNNSPISKLISDIQGYLQVPDSDEPEFSKILEETFQL